MKINISLALIIVLILGCASHQEADVRASGPKRITNMMISKKTESLILTIEGNRALTYTAEKLVFPMGVVLQFPDTSLELPRRIYLPPDNEFISSIKANEKIEDQTTSARIFIAFKKDTSYDLSPDAGRLKVTFPATGALSNDAQLQSKSVEKEPEPEKKSEPEIIQYGRPTANYLKTVTATPLKDKITVEVKADTAINNYKSFILDRPPRIVFDLYNLKSPYKKEQTVSVASPWVQRIRHFAHPDKVRLVLETHKNYLSKYSTFPNDTGLLIHVGNTDTAPNKASQTAPDATPGTQQVKLTAYNVYWRSSPGVTKHNGNKISNVQSPAVIKNLRSGVTYYFVVTTVIGSKESPESEEFSYTPGE
jgi:type IV pilus assembly protein PilQ